MPTTSTCRSSRKPCRATRNLATRPDRREAFRSAVLSLGILLAGPSLAAPVEPTRNDTSLLATDLRADGQGLPEGGVLILLVSLPDCHWCHQIRSRYLLPIQGDIERHPDLRIREIRLTGDDAGDFDGRRKGIEAIAARWSVQVAPTVLFLDRCGMPLTEALIGGDVAGFYGAYFDRALAAAQAQAQSQAGIAPRRGC